MPKNLVDNTKIDTLAAQLVPEYFFVTTKRC